MIKVLKKRIKSFVEYYATLLNPRNLIAKLLRKLRSSNIMKYMGLYPPCFPSNFENDILPKGAELKKRCVYRIAKFGKINRDAFISTYEEVERGLIPPKGLDLKDPGTYSTSVNEDLKDIEKVLKMMMRHNPRPKILKGCTEPSCGPSQLTRDREPSRKDSHVDWWIYDKSNPENYFEEFKI